MAPVDRKREWWTTALGGCVVCGAPLAYPTGDEKRVLETRSDVDTLLYKYGLSQRMVLSRIMEPEFVDNLRSLSRARLQSMGIKAKDTWHEHWGMPLDQVVRDTARIRYPTCRDCSRAMQDVSREYDHAFQGVLESVWFLAVRESYDVKDEVVTRPILSNAKALQSVFTFFELVPYDQLDKGILRDVITGTGTGSKRRKRRERRRQQMQVARPLVGHLIKRRVGDDEWWGKIVAVMVDKEMGDVVVRVRYTGARGTEILETAYARSLVELQPSPPRGVSRELRQVEARYDGEVVTKPLALTNDNFAFTNAGSVDGGSGSSASDDSDDDSETWSPVSATSSESRNSESHLRSSWSAPFRGVDDKVSGDDVFVSLKPEYASTAADGDGEDGGVGEGEDVIAVVDSPPSTPVADSAKSAPDTPPPPRSSLFGGLLGGKSNITGGRQLVWQPRRKAEVWKQHFLVNTAAHLMKWGQTKQGRHRVLAVYWSSYYLWLQFATEENKTRMEFHQWYVHVFREYYMRRYPENTWFTHDVDSIGGSMDLSRNGEDYGSTYDIAREIIRFVRGQLVRLEEDITGVNLWVFNGDGEKIGRFKDMIARRETITRALQTIREQGGGMQAFYKLIHARQGLALYFSWYEFSMIGTKYVRENVKAFLYEVDRSINGRQFRQQQ